jgi:hypothetical protein
VNNIVVLAIFFPPLPIIPVLNSRAVEAHSSIIYERSTLPALHKMRDKRRKDMRSCRHRRGRITFEILGALLVASLGVARWEANHSIRGLILAVAVGAYALYRSVMLLARNPAFAYGNHGVQVGRVLKVCQFRWDQIRDIRETVWHRPHIPFLHFLPSERHYIELQIHDAGVESGTMKLRTDMIELPAGGVKEVIDSFRAAQIAALGERGAASARLGVKASGEAAQPLSAIQWERMQRLGIGVDEQHGGEAIAQPAAQPAAPQPNLPQRPAFGRKVG